MAEIQPQMKPQRGFWRCRCLAYVPPGAFCYCGRNEKGEMIDDAKPTWEWMSLVYMGQSVSGKTSIWWVYTKIGHHFLGQIRWYARWRCYVFEPKSCTAYSTGCLEDIKDFLQHATTRHKRPKERGPETQRG